MHVLVAQPVARIDLQLRQSLREMQDEALSEISR